MKGTFDKLSAECSRIVTKNYSTSFSLGINFLDEKLRGPIYAIYGFVRLADEILKYLFLKTMLPLDTTRVNGTVMSGCFQKLLVNIPPFSLTGNAASVTWKPFSFNLYVRYLKKQAKGHA